MTSRNNRAGKAVVETTLLRTTTKHSFLSAPGRYWVRTETHRDDYPEKLEKRPDIKQRYEQRMTTLKLVLFDMDGVIFEARISGWNCISAWAQKNRRGSYGGDWRHDYLRLSGLTARKNYGKGARRKFSGND